MPETDHELITRASTLLDRERTRHVRDGRFAWEQIDRDMIAMFPELVAALARLREEHDVIAREQLEVSVAHARAANARLQGDVTTLRQLVRSWQEADAEYRTSASPHLPHTLHAAEAALREADLPREAAPAGEAKP